MRTFRLHTLWMGLEQAHRPLFLQYLERCDAKKALDWATLLRLVEQKGPHVNQEELLCLCNAQWVEAALNTPSRMDEVHLHHLRRPRFSKADIAEACQKLEKQFEAFQAIQPLFSTRFYKELKKRNRSWVLEDFLHHLKVKYRNSAKQLQRLARYIHEQYAPFKSVESQAESKKDKVEEDKLVEAPLIKSLDKEVDLFLLQYKLRNAELCKLMCLLQPSDHQEFLWWVQRPCYGKPSHELPQLVELILKKVIHGNGIDEAGLYRQWQKGKSAFNQHAKSKLKASMGILEKALEDFFAMKENERSKPRQSIALLRSLNQRGGGAHFEKQFDKALAALEPGDESYYELRYALEECKVRHEMGVQDRLQKPTYSTVIRFAAEHTIVLQTRLVCDALMHRLVSGKELDLAPVRLLPLLPQLDGQVPVLSQAFQKAWLMLENPQEKRYLEDLIQLLKKEKSRFGQDDLRRLYKFALNVCIAQINSSRLDYTVVLDQIFEDTLPKGLLLQNGVIECSYLRNIVVANARKGNIQAAKKFYHEYHDKIAQVNDPCTPEYLAAIIRYYDQPGREALEELLDRFNEFADTTKDEHYKTDAWVFRIRIAIDLQDWAQALKFVNSFRGHLGRCESISEQQLKKYQHFHRYITRFADNQLKWKSPPFIYGKKENVAHMRKVVRRFQKLWSDVLANAHVVAHEWLKEKLEAAMEEIPRTPPQLMA